MNTLHMIYAIVGGYCLGSIPFGLLIARATGQGDIRKIGSGNIGATNVLRTGRKDIAIITLLLDAAKAAIAYFVFSKIFAQATVDNTFFDPLRYGLAAAFAALLGHCFPIWLGFIGGKGVATFFGGLLAAAWPVGLIAAAIWIALAVLTRISSLSALTAAALSPFVCLVLGYYDVGLMAGAMALVIYVRHKDNILRILRGQESKIGGASKKDAE